VERIKKKEGLRGGKKTPSAKKKKQRSKNYPFLPTRNQEAKGEVKGG